MAIYIKFEDIENALDFIKNNSDITFESILNFLMKNGFSEDSAKKWINLFLETLYNFLNTFDFNEAIQWMKNQLNSGKSTEELTNMLITLFSANLTENVIILRDGVVYKEIISHNSTPQRPKGIQTIHFSQTQVEMVGGVRKVIININIWYWQFNFVDMPDSFKRTYVLWLKLQNEDVSDDLIQWSVDKYDTNDIIFEIDLDKAEKMF